MPKRRLNQPCLAEERSVRSKTMRDIPLECEHDESSTTKENRQFDNISGLIDLDLHRIVENIFSKLSETMVANAAIANAKWASFITNNQRAKHFFQEMSPPLLYTQDALSQKRTFK